MEHVLDQKVLGGAGKLPEGTDHSKVQLLLIKMFKLLSN